MYCYFLEVVDDLWRLPTDYQLDAGPDRLEGGDDIAGVQPGVLQGDVLDQQRLVGEQRVLRVLRVQLGVLLQPDELGLLLHSLVHFEVTGKGDGFLNILHDVRNKILVFLPQPPDNLRRREMRRDEERERLAGD